MPAISFYILASESTAERDVFACKLIEKIYRSGACAYVLTDNAQQSQLFDRLLWTFRAGSFIPHQTHTGTLPTAENAILIGSDTPPEHWQKTLINVSSHCPQNFAKSERILEILDNSVAAKTLGRDRYRRYQQAGIAITTHKM
ncbi:DNA polymerase III subunit chi [Crenothrix polyspora]|uniref:DNA polymerase III chi subunit HolC n=1 Tax=Crenothrix polyspora TaxID=360316 RepID=A0A1R4HDK1_9GAMM|nr:DNA polymerase III subunit chi [Crenothrix polyspora]SJM93960.1 DNA polymerase III chi subunit HolC [Crenothrix polyspora]